MSPRWVDTWARDLVMWFWSVAILSWQLSIDHFVNVQYTRCGLAKTCLRHPSLPFDSLPYPTLTICRCVRTYVRSVNHLTTKQKEVDHILWVWGSKCALESCYHWITTILEARQILPVVSHFNLSVLANETLSVSLCREIDNVFGTIRTCFDHMLSKFSGFLWKRILFLKSTCVNMVMQIQVQIGDTRRVFFMNPPGMLRNYSTTFCVRLRRHVLCILVYFMKTMKENM